MKGLLPNMRREDRGAESYDPVRHGRRTACDPRTDASHPATLMARNVGTAGLVSLVHTVAMVIAGGAMALSAYAWLGLTLIARSWVNLDLAWAASLILIGVIAPVTA